MISQLVFAFFHVTEHFFGDVCQIPVNRVRELQALHTERSKSITMNITIISQYHRVSIAIIPQKSTTTMSTTMAQKIFLTGLSWDCRISKRFHATLIARKGCILNWNDQNDETCRGGRARPAYRWTGRTRSNSKNGTLHSTSEKLRRDGWRFHRVKTCTKKGSKGI